MRTPEQVKQMMLDSADQLLSIRTDKPELTGPRKTKTTHLIGHDELSSIPPDATVICVSSTITERNAMQELLPTALHIRCKDEESIQSGFDSLLRRSL